jgi:hypothetical protein
VDDRLKELMQELGQAINESISESEGIAEVIGRIKSEGYDVFLVLEATIGFNRRDEVDGVKQERQTHHFDPEEFSFSEQDEAFLRGLKITSDE